MQQFAKHMQKMQKTYLGMALLWPKDSSKPIDVQSALFSSIIAILNISGTSMHKFLAQVVNPLKVNLMNFCRFKYLTKHDSSPSLNDGNTLANQDLEPNVNRGLQDVFPFIFFETVVQNVNNISGFSMTKMHLRISENLRKNHPRPRHPTGNPLPPTNHVCLNTWALASQQPTS